jgi:hypothetical protein
MNAKTITEYRFPSFAYCVFQILVHEIRAFLHTI